MWCESAGDIKMKQGFSVLALAAVMMIATTSEAKAASGKDEASSPKSDGSDATENPGNLPEYTTFADIEVRAVPILVVAIISGTKTKFDQGPDSPD